MTEKMILDHEAKPGFKPALWICIAAAALYLTYVFLTGH